MFAGTKLLAGSSNNSKCLVVGPGCTAVGLARRSCYVPEDLERKNQTAKYLWRADQLRKVPAAVRFLSLEPLLGPLGTIDLSGIRWVMVGGESGPGARPIDAAWVRDICKQCRRENMPFFFKQ